MITDTRPVRRVFISYSHDSDEHKARVHALANRLRRDGVTVVLDRDMLPGGPSEGWPEWSERQVKEVELVLVACTETYRQRYEGNQAPGSGTWLCRTTASGASTRHRAGWPRHSANSRPSLPLRSGSLPTIRRTHGGSRI
jgi:TIR domain